MQQINVVISGFDHYDGIDVNPAVEVPRVLAEQGLGAAPDGTYDDPLADVQVNVRAVALPVSFANAWPALRDVIDTTHPDIVIATGLKHTARGILLERCATNLMDAARPDADNATPRREAINPDGPAAYWTRLPLRSILKDFARDGVPAALSSDAGTFVCNSLFYNLLNWTATQDQVLGGFVSLPRVAARGFDHGVARRGLPLDRQVAAVRDVVREAVRYRRSPSSGDILID